MEINQQDINALGNKGADLGRLGKYEEAITYFDKALKLEPSYADIWYDKVRSNMKIKNINTTLNDLNNAIKIGEEYKMKAKNDNNFYSIRTNNKFNKLVK